MQRTNYHKKNASGLVSARTKRTSVDNKSKEKHPSRSKDKQVDIALQNKIKKRMSFASPSRKNNDSSTNGPIKNFSLLNYMLFLEKHRDSVPGMATHRDTAHQSLSKDHFVILEILGKGGFGKVYKVQQKRTSHIYAMKQMSKAVVLTKNSVASVMNQRRLLSELKHPFLVNMVYAFQDRMNLYLIMDYMPGGDLRFQLGRVEFFPENVVKFFVCCILLSLKYLHENNVLHRDIKPENLIFDSKGYLRLTDMGVAKIDSPKNQEDTSGTPGYMAPEVITRDQHSFPVDFFALGVIAYECMLGRRPYRGYNRQEIRQQMLLYEASIKPHQLPKGWNPQAADFINQLLKRKPAARLGYNGVEEAMSHPWLQDINWTKMLSKKYPAPFMPDFSHRNYDTVSESEYSQRTEQKLAHNSLLLRNNEVQGIFEGYQYHQVKLT